MSEIDNFMTEWKEKMSEFDENLASARKLSRAVIYRIIILTASIIGFSVSLFSIPILQSNLDLDILKYSWYFFVGVIICGFFILMFEGRIKYAKTWKAFQASQYPRSYNYSCKEVVYASLIVILTLLHPGNLIFNGFYKNDHEKEKLGRVNGLVVHKLASIDHALIIFENLLLTLFVCGLIFLVISFG